LAERGRRHIGAWSVQRRRLEIGVEQITTSPLPDATFVLTVPPDAVPLSIEDLRAMFRGKGR